MSIKLGMLPSTILDPEGIHLSGLDRLMFDGILVGKGAEEERLASGDDKDLSASKRAEYAMAGLDTTESDELERLREKMRQNG